MFVVQRPTSNVSDRAADPAFADVLCDVAAAGAGIHACVVSFEPLDRTCQLVSTVGAVTPFSVGESRRSSASTPSASSRQPMASVGQSTASSP